MDKSLLGFVEQVVLESGGIWGVAFGSATSHPDVIERDAWVAGAGLEKSWS
jgi:hypothetical protein